MDCFLINHIILSIERLKKYKSGLIHKHKSDLNIEIIYYLNVLSFRTNLKTITSSIEVSIFNGINFNKKKKIWKNNMK